MKCLNSLPLSKMTFALLVWGESDSGMWKKQGVQCSRPLLLKVWSVGQLVRNPNVGLHCSAAESESAL